MPKQTDWTGSMCVFFTRLVEKGETDGIGCVFGKTIGCRTRRRPGVG